MYGAQVRSAVAVSLLAAALVALTGCPKPPDSALDAGDDAGALSAPCPDGFARSPSQPAVCVEIVPTGACDGGTAPFIGSQECQPVGWTAPCPPDFDRAPDGFGCLDRSPPHACDGGTRETVGSSTCVPVGDCTTAFPPAGALLVDATHFQSISAAVAAAPSGAVIAIAPGRYTEHVTITRPLTLLGRCAAQVTLATPAATGPGLKVAGVRGVTVSGLTLEGFASALELTGGAAVTASGLWVSQSVGAGVYVEGSRLSLSASKVSGTALRSDGKWGWALAAGVGSTVTVDDSSLVDGTTGVYAASADTAVTLTRTVVARQRPQGLNRATGVISFDGSVIKVSRSVLEDGFVDAAAMADEGGRIELDETIARGTRVMGALARGHGLAAVAGGFLVARSVTVQDAESVSLSVQTTLSRLELSNVVVRGPARSQAAVSFGLEVSSDKSGIGAQILDGATATFDSVVILGAWGFGVYAFQGGELTAHRLYIDGTRSLTAPGPLDFAVGVTTWKGGTVTLSDSTILHGALAGASAGTLGTVRATALLVRDVAPAVPLATGASASVGHGGVLDFTRCAFVNSSAVALLTDISGGSRVRLVGTAIHGTLAPGGAFGHGVAVAPNTTFFADDCFFFENGSVALVDSGGGAMVTRSVFSRNAIAVHAQNGSFLSQSDDTSALQPGELRISSDTAFSENATKMGVGVVPVPPSGF